MKAQELTLLIVGSGKRQSVTFAVVDENGERVGDLWRVRATKRGDVYVGNGIMPACKASLHASGVCRFVYPM